VLRLSPLAGGWRTAHSPRYAIDSVELSPLSCARRTAHSPGAAPQRNRRRRA